MRGSGYAIGEILIFLAIAAIIGFLIGWLVFYRRPDKAPSGLAPTNPNHVKRLEERAKTADAKVVRIEKRANLLLESLSKAAPATASGAAAAPGDTEDKKISIAPAAAAPDAKAVEAAGKPADSKPDSAKQAVADKTEDAKQAVADKTEDAKQAVADKKKSAKDAPPAKDDGVDDYLSEADDRISKLEETLDKLSEKLAELEDD